MIRLVRVGREPRIQLFLGALRVRQPADSVIEVASPLGLARVHGASDAEVEIPRDPWMSSDELRVSAVAWASGAPPPARSLLLAVDRGSGDVNGMVANGGSLLVVERNAVAVLSTLPPPRHRVVLDRLFREIRVGAADVDSTLPNAFELRKRGTHSARDLQARLTEHPEYWGYVLPRLTLLPGERHRDVKTRLIGILAEDPELRAGWLFGELLRTEAASIELDPLLRLAERGFRPAHGEIAARFSASEGDARILLALYFAMRGDPRGMADLEAVLSNKEWRSRRTAFYFASASALTVLGEDAPWNDTIRWLAAEVERRLASGMLPFARWLTLCASYFHQVIQSGEPVELAYLGYTVSAWESRHEDSLSTAEQIRAILGRLPK
jgi:hypothetical protein